MFEELDILCEKAGGLFGSWHFVVKFREHTGTALVDNKKIHQKPDSGSAILIDG
jgi:hypothetical protein